VRNDLDLVATDLLNVDAVAEVAGAAFNLDAVVEELFEGRDIKDFVGDGLGAVDGVLVPMISL
jgi:hypothetical protein